MISNQLWIGAVDHRISAAIVLFVLMLLLFTGVFDTFLYAARTWIMDLMFNGTSFAWYAGRSLAG